MLNTVNNKKKIFVICINLTNLFDTSKLYNGGCKIRKVWQQGYCFKSDQSLFRKQNPVCDKTVVLDKQECH